MERMKFESDNLVDSNIEKIEKLFPNCITEGKDENGKLKKAINFDMLKQMLLKDVVEGDEAYEFTWVGKKESIVEAHKPIRKTLRPCKEESVNWDKTENLYIEGDNLDVLKLLQESYLNKVKMIYIDPPYNTGNDFIYRDNRSRSQHEENVAMGMYDEDDNKLFRNKDPNGKFHSDWCSMIYPRLTLARNLLSDNGVIFISIDDHEVHNLRSICDEVFGGKNFITNIIWQKKFSPQNDATYFSQMHDFILCYAKKKKSNKNDIGWDRNLLDRDSMPDGYKNPDNDPRGPWSSGDFTAEGPTPNCVYEIISPTGKKWMPPEGKRWVYNYGNFLKLYEENRFWFGKDGNALPRIKRYWSEVQQGMVPNSIWLFDEVGHTQEGKQETNNLFGATVFDHPKPIRLLGRILKLSTSAGDIVLDFFSGSASTAHAVMRLNAEDGGNRKFIMVQTDKERCDEKSEAFKAGYKNICEIGKERIRRAGKKIINENPDKADSLDIGFRTFKLDSTNMKDVYYSAGDYTQNLLDSLESNIKPDRTDLDLLFGCLLEWGLPLSMPYKSDVIDGCTVHIYNDGDLIACFDENISDDVIKAIAERKPLHAVFRDSSFKNSPSKINSFEIFKMISPDTKLRVI